MMRENSECSCGLAGSQLDCGRNFQKFAFSFESLPQSCPAWSHLLKHFTKARVHGGWMMTSTVVGRDSDTFTYDQNTFHVFFALGSSLEPGTLFFSSQFPTDWATATNQLDSMAGSCYSCREGTSATQGHRNPWSEVLRWAVRIHMLEEREWSASPRCEWVFTCLGERIQQGCQWKKGNIMGLLLCLKMECYTTSAPRVLPGMKWTLTSCLLKILMSFWFFWNQQQQKWRASFRGPHLRAPLKNRFFHWLSPWLFSFKARSAIQK